MKMPTISNLLSLLNSPLSELVGVGQSRTVPVVQRGIEIAEDTVSRLLRHEGRKKRAAQWQGLPLEAELLAEDLEFSARTSSCQVFNGDFYGLEEVVPGHYSFYLGDVSGKGLRAAFYQTSCLTLLQQAARVGTDPEDVMNEMNHVLAARENEDRYATLIYGTYDSATKLLTLASAGHPLPFLVSSEGEISEVDCPHGLPVGLNSTFNYRSRKISVEPGETLILYSDGLTEARNEQRDFLGEMGLLELLLRHCDKPLPTVTEEVMREVDCFAPKRSDDQTILALRFGDSVTTI